MSEQNKKLILEYIDAVNGKPKPKSVVDKYVADSDMELKQHIEVFEGAFPEYEMIVLDVIAEGEKVVVRFQFNGKHLGQFKEIPPTGNDITMNGIIIYQLQNAMIVDHWMATDMSDLIRQLQPKNEIVLI